MWILSLLLIVFPGIMINRWLTAKEQAKKRRGFEVKQTPGIEPGMNERDNDHG